jgi:hypothetical protein
MRDFTRPRGRLRSLPLSARVVYSVFLAFSVTGLALSAWLAEDMVGLDLSRLRAYYAGGGAEPAQERPLGGADSGGPALELPPAAEAAAVEPPMPTRKLLEVTHFHLFSMPIYLLVLSHLFMLSRLSEATKVGWIALATLSVAGHMLAPWVARADAAPAGIVYGATGVLMTASLLVLAICPLLEMWAPGGGSSAAGPNLDQE